MANVINYKAVQKYNPQEPDVRKYYAQAVYVGELSTDELAEKIQSKCTVTKTDVKAVLSGLSDVIVEGLKGSQIVRLSDFGYLRISLSSTGVEDGDELSASNIKKARIIFYPTDEVAQVLNVSNLDFKKV